MKNNNKTEKCQVCHKDFPKSKLFPLALVRPNLLETIKENKPECDGDGYICSHDLKELRSKHVEKLLTSHKGAISDLDKEVLESIEEHETITQNINKEFSQKLSFGERLSDRVAKFGGSWPFILSFLAVIVVWMIVNSLFFYRRPFDPYPYILLNLVLSCLAAMQAPIIMMSQNRQAKRDRIQADDEYQTNLKAELEVRQLNSKIDLFMKKQWEMLLEIQQIQIDLSEEIIDNYKKKS